MGCNYLNVDDFHNRLDELKSEKLDMKNELLAEINTVSSYLNSLTSIEIFECDSCGAEISYEEYNANDGCCYDCSE